MNTIPKKVALQPLTGQRPALFDLWTMYQFHTGLLAIKANVPPGTVQAMVGNQPVRRCEAERVLAQLSAILHQEFTLQTVYVALLTE